MLVANVDAQNEMIHRESLRPKTPPSVICDSVYGDPNPVTSGRSLMISVYLKRYDTLTNGDTPK
jgi:hypothetical protein